MAWIKVTMNGKQYEALTHALIDIGFKPTSGKPYIDEIDIVWRKANKDLKMDGKCIVNRNNEAYTITLGW